MVQAIFETSFNTYAIDDRRNPWRDSVVLVFWDGDGGRPGGRMILCGGATGGVGRQVMRQTLPWRGV